MVQIYEGDFNATGKGTAKTRRMTKRRLKKYLVQRLNEVWDAATVTSFPRLDLTQKLGTFR